MQDKFYIYLHRRATDNTVFYVGKGHGKRAWFVNNRSNRWNYIVTKHGYNVVIVQDNLTEEQAFILEKELIADIGKESLCNMTDGGEGASGLVHSEESRRKMSNASIGRKKTEEHKQKIREFNIGRKLPDETRKKISAALKGRPALNKGKRRSLESREKQKATIAANKLIKQP